MTSSSLSCRPSLSAVLSVVNGNAVSSSSIKCADLCLFYVLVLNCATPQKKKNWGKKILKMLVIVACTRFLVATCSAQPRPNGEILPIFAYSRCLGAEYRIVDAFTMLLMMPPVLLLQLLLVHTQFVKFCLFFASSRCLDAEYSHCVCVCRCLISSCCLLLVHACHALSII